jgi:hypothetical protein
VRVAALVVAAVTAAWGAPAAPADPAPSPAIDWRPVWTDPPKADALLVLPYGGDARPSWRLDGRRAPGRAVLPPPAPSALDRGAGAPPACAPGEACLIYAPAVPGPAGGRCPPPYDPSACW